MPDNGTTNWPANTDDLNLPADMTIAPTSAGDGHYTFKQWLERVTGMLRATATDLLTGMTHNLPMGGFKVTGLGTPTVSTDAATKAYVDATAQGLSVKQSVKGASTTNHSVSAFSGSTIDGGSVSLSANDRILLKDQSTASQNGIWVFNGAGSALTRPTDFATGAQEAGAFVFVESGTANANRGYVLSGTAITVDTTAQTWVQFSGAGEITAGTGLTKTGDTINAVANADGTIIANADDLQVGTLVAGNVPSGLITSTMIANNTILDADVNASAAIAYSKLALTGSIVNADVSASAAIAFSKLAGSGAAGGVLSGSYPNPAFASSNVTTILATNATWAIPSGATLLRITAAGGGGQGGGGGSNAAGATQAGGGGGGAGGVVTQIVAVGANSTLNVTIGAGGSASGTGAVAGGATGSAGSNGGVTTVVATGISISAAGGGGGATGGASSSSAVGGGFYAKPGANASVTFTPGSGGNSALPSSPGFGFAGGGGGGGGNSNTTNGGGGGAAGVAGSPAAIAGVAGASGTAAGVVGGSAAANSGCGGGGGGGGTNGTGAGGNGGNGGSGFVIVEVIG